MNTNLWRFRQSPIIVSFVGLALITDGRCANNPDKNVGTTASGTVVIVHNEAECHRDPIPKEFLPNSVQPVNIIVVNVNTTASFESDLRNQEDEFRIPIQQIGHRFTFFFKYPDTKSSTYKTYSVLSPSSTSLVKLPALVDKGLFVGQVCLAKTDDKQPTVPQRPSFRAPANWDGYATLAGLSRLTAPFQTFALYDLVSEEDDHGAGLVSGRIVEYLSTVPRKASELKPVSGLRVTVTGGMNGSNMTENLAGGVSDKTAITDWS